MQFEQITLVGVGLLGGSLGLAVKKRGLAGRVVGLVRRPESVTECVELGVVDEATLDAEAAIKDADLIVHCAPISQMRALTETFLQHMKPGAIVTDVGSVKECVVNDLEQLIADADGHFVGSHPMAGGEQTGVAHSREDLFEGATVVITQTANINPESATKMDAFWSELRAAVVKMSPAEHDRVVAMCSHMPHVAAAAVVAVVLSDAGELSSIQQVCGSGFRDTTRIASGDPVMWRDIVLENRGNVSSAIGELIAKLQGIKSLLDDGDLDPDVIEAMLADAKRSRDAWLATRSTSVD